MMTPGSAERASTPIDEIAEAYLTRYAVLDPLAATAIGISGHDHEMTDLSPAGLDARAALARSTLASLDGQTPVDVVDELTLAAMRERLGLAVELYDAGEEHRYLNNIASPVQNLRDIFDVMPTDTVEAWSNIAARLNALPFAVDGYIESLRLGATLSGVAPARQVEEAARQAAELADPEASFFTTFITGELVDSVLDESAACSLVRAELEHGASRGPPRRTRRSPRSCATSSHRWRRRRTRRAGERYALWSRQFLGATVDLDETYQWGLEELARVVAEQEAVAAQIAGPGATVADAVAVLDADPSRLLTGTDALQAWMQETADARDRGARRRALRHPRRAAPPRVPDRADPERRHLLHRRRATTSAGRAACGGRCRPRSPRSTPGARRRPSTTRASRGITCRSARPSTSGRRSTGGVGSRAGPRGTARAGRCTASGSWRTSGSSTTRATASACWTASACARPASCSTSASTSACPPRRSGAAARGTPTRAGSSSRPTSNMPEAFIRFEWNRYLGWPGQAPSYKIGQRLWEQTRDEAAAKAAAAGEAFDIRAFHARALSMGSLPLDVLKQAFAA